MAIHYKPLLQSWKRIESRSRVWDFSENLANPIHDALWLLTRQWQFGEFQAEDAGVAVDASVHYQQTALAQLHLASQGMQAIDHSVPLDALIERTNTNLDLDLRLEMGLHWLRMIDKQLPKAKRKKVRKAFQKHPDFQFQLPQLDEAKALGLQADLLTNEAYLQMLHAAIRTGSIDGGVLFNRLKRGKKASSFLANSDREVNQLGKQFLAWFERVYSQSVAGENENWQADRLEYQFTCTVPQEGGFSHHYKAKEYHGRQLGWYTGDMQHVMAGESVLGENIQLPEKHSSCFIPSPVRFAGMPNSRWWALEDNTINFGDIGMAPTDISKLIFAEFGLVYGNDWLLFPLDLPNGSMSKIEKILVTDSFGVMTEVRSAKATKPNDPWQVFQLFNDDPIIDHNLFLPPVNPQVLESKPLEEIHFMRDQMANMVWGIEKIIPNNLGDGTDAFDQGLRTKRFLEKLEGTTEISLQKNEAKVRYEMATEVPENWIPFVAKRLNEADDNSQIKLQRAAMPRVLKGFPVERIRPRTSLLQKGLEDTSRSPYYIQEEEIPRAGAILRLKWRRTRWIDGKVVVWLAREKTNGRGEVESALQFDRIRKKE